jgi:MFS family permease
MNDSATTTEAPTLVPLSKNKPYLQFQAARLSWTLAVQVLGVAIAWQVFDATKKPLSLGFVGLAQFLPMFAFSLVTGKVADTFDRRKIMIACYVLSAIAATVLLVANLTGHARMPLVYTTLVMLGIARAFGGPAGQSLGATLVPKEQLASAIAWGSSVWQLTLIGAPTAGGLLVAVGNGPNFAYGVTLGVLAFAIATMALLRVKPRTHEAPKERGLGALFAGVRYVRDTRIILGAISLDLFAVLLGGAVALLPFFAKELDVGAWGYGMLRSAPAVGAALVAALVGRFPIQKGAGIKMFACVFAFGVATIAFGVSKSFVLSLVALFITGAADMVSVVVRMTLVQVMTPDEMRGRVSAVNNVFIGASNELGEFESGITAEWLTPRIATVVGGIGTCVVVLAWMAMFPALRKVDRLDGASS